MVDQTSEKLLDSEIENVVYPIDPNSLSVEDTVVCEAGMVPVDYRCGIYIIFLVYSRFIIISMFQCVILWLKGCNIIFQLASNTYL